MTTTDPKTPDFDSLINSLTDPATYPHPVDVITTIETHISIVFLTGDFAYKLKKPVDFGFLDFTKLSDRKIYCQLEVELNRRTAPELYLGVLPIYWNSKQNGVSLSPLEDQYPVDYLVKMKQFDPNNVLGRQGEDLQLGINQLDTIALQIAKLHMNAEKVDLSTRLGTPGVILKPMADNFKALSVCFNLSKHPRLETLSQWTEHTFHLLEESLISRRQAGKIRACHGDLHLDNIALIDEQPVLFDGIEFNDAFRWIDPSSDLAFLLMDLASRKHPQLAWYILSVYLHVTQDYDSLKLLRFYMVYRALVRSKITNLRANQLENESYERGMLCQVAGNYVDLAYQLSQQPEKPKLILLQGVSGTGKSYLASALQKIIDAVVISSDRTRKSLYGIDPLQRVDDSDRSQLYSSQMNAKTYQALLDNSRTSLQANWHTIVDATFLKKEHRQNFYDLAKTLDIPVYLLFIDSDTSEDSVFLAEQIRLREIDNQNPSDADAAVMLNQMKYLQKPDSDEPCIWLNAQQIRREIPLQKIKEFLELPITE